MNKQDNSAFEKWVDNDSLSPMELKLFSIMNENQKIMFCSERTWQAALEYERSRHKSINIGLGRELIAERERSKILVEALEFYANEDNWEKHETTHYDLVSVLYPEDSGQKAKESLSKYKGEV